MSWTRAKRMAVAKIKKITQDQSPTKVEAILSSDKVMQCMTDGTRKSGQTLPKWRRPWASPWEVSDDLGCVIVEDIETSDAEIQLCSSLDRTHEIGMQNLPGWRRTLWRTSRRCQLTMPRWLWRTSRRCRKCRELHHRQCGKTFLTTWWKKSWKRCYDAA